MKKPSSNINVKVYNKIILFVLFVLFVLGVLGFSSGCKLNSGNNVICEYGKPSAQFKLIGNVTSNENGQAISNIKVKMQQDSAFTDDEGNFTLTAFGFPEEHTYSISFEDIDGIQDGEYSDKEIDVTFPGKNFRGVTKIVMKV